MGVIADALNKAYKLSTAAVNLFEEAVRAVKWDSEFTEGDTKYFLLGNLCMMAQSLNPVDCKWKPEVANMSSGDFREIGW